MYSFQAPYDDDAMSYNSSKKRYILKEEYVRQLGIDLGLILDTQGSPEPSKLPALILDRISLLVYTNIYNYGRQVEDKEYLLACNSLWREPIRDAMVERLRYMVDSGDLSTRSGALISQGTRVDVKDLVAGVVEEMILRRYGILHRGRYDFVRDDTITY